MAILCIVSNKSDLLFHNVRISLPLDANEQNAKNFTKTYDSVDTQTPSQFQFKSHTPSLIYPHNKVIVNRYINFRRRKLMKRKIRSFLEQ